MMYVSSFAASYPSLFPLHLVPLPPPLPSSLHPSKGSNHLLADTRIGFREGFTGVTTQVNGPVRVGQRRSTKVNEGQRRSTKVNEGQRRSTKVNEVTGFDGDNGDQESKQIEEGWRVDGQRG